MKIFSNVLFLLLLVVGFAACDKTGDDNDTNQILVIENGAINAQPNANITYTAALIDDKGTRTAATDVTWTSSDNSIVTIGSNGQATIASVGTATIKASVKVGNSTLTTEAPLQIQGVSAFSVAPSAILVDTEFPDIQLNAVYLGTGSTTYNYTSSNTSVATVSSTGNVSFVGVGNCQITVEAPGIGATYIVPVAVLGVPQIKLPIARIVVSPDAKDMLKNETATYTAKAYDLDNQEVSATIQWSVEDNSIATIDASGTVTAKAVGTTKIRAMADGIIGTAEANVYPDKVLVVTPFTAAIPAGGTRAFSVSKYDVIRQNGELVLGAGVATNNVNWSIPTYGFSLFDIATVDANGLVTMKSNAQIGLLTVLLAEDKNDASINGAASVSVAIGSGGGSGCACGTAVANATGVNLTSSNAVTVSFGQNAQIQANVVDAQGNTISAANLVYCSDNVQVADVDSNGEISGTAFSGGTAVITVCHGTFSETINVTVQ